MTAGRLDYTFEDGRYVEELVDEQTCTITSTDSVTNELIDEAMRCEFTTEVGGQYEITAIVTDDDGRSNRAVYTQWVSGGDGSPDPRPRRRARSSIVPDAEFHAPGDTAELLVQAPFAPASGLVTVTRAGIESVEAFDAPDGSAVITVPIDDDDIPDVDVRVDMVGTDERVADDGTPLPDAPPQPAFAAGQIGLQIPPRDTNARCRSPPRPPSNVEPGDVDLGDRRGRPTPTARRSAEPGSALIVVDEAVLSLTGYELADPLDAFYQPASRQLDPQLLRDSIILANPDLFAADGERTGVPATTATTEAMEESDGAEADGRRSTPSARRLRRCGDGGAGDPTRRSTSAPTSMRSPCSLPTSSPAPTAP